MNPAGWLLAVALTLLNTLRAGVHCQWEFYQFYGAHWVFPVIRASFIYICR